MSQSLELPDDVLAIIKEYARPITRPDWRTLHLMTNQHYKTEYYLQYVKRKIMLYSSLEYNRMEATYKIMFNQWHFDHTFGIPKIDWYINS
jgi:hypothetical protein